MRVYLKILGFLGLVAVSMFVKVVVIVWLAKFMGLL